MKKYLSCLLILLALLLPALGMEAGAAETVNSGSCGENLTWTLDDAGTLTISGTGAMEDYAYLSNVPWYSQRTSIVSVVVEDGVTSIGDSAFEECDSLSSITIPEGVTSIGDRAFDYCKSLSSITIPDSVTSIGDYAFGLCKSLSSITIPEGVTSIGEYAFAFCNSLSSITIPEGVTSIGEGAFDSCDSLSSITLPDSLTSIGDEAFLWCTSLSSITIPEGVTSIGSGAFSRCVSLDGIWVEDGNPNYSSDDHGVLFNKYKSQLIRAPEGISGAYSVPDSVTSIGDRAFYDCDSLSSITIPESVTSIGDGTFYGCASLSTVHYAGTETQRADISVGEYNADLTDATWHYECDGVACLNPETPPTEPEVTEPEVTEPEITEPEVTEPEVTEPEETKPEETKPEVTEPEVTEPEEIKPEVTEPEVTEPEETKPEETKPEVTEPEVTEPEETKPEVTEPKPTEPEVTEPQETQPDVTKPEEDTSPENPFVDVYREDYYYDPVLWAVKENITTGMDETHFAPAEICSRGQVVTFLWRANGCPEPQTGYNPFRDVKMTDYFYKAVLWAVENGITSGVAADSFAPGAACTRGQVATFLWRSQGQPSSDGENIFTDIAPGAYYYDAVLWAVANGITNGVGEGLFAPDATCTRGQIVTFLYRAMNE